MIERRPKILRLGDKFDPCVQSTAGAAIIESEPVFYNVLLSSPQIGVCHAVKRATGTCGKSGFRHSSVRSGPDDSGRVVAHSEVVVGPDLAGGHVGVLPVSRKLGLVNGILR